MGDQMKEGLPFAGDDVGLSIQNGSELGSRWGRISFRYPGGVLCANLGGDLQPTSWDIGSGSLCSPCWWRSAAIPGHPMKEEPREPDQTRLDVHLGAGLSLSASSSSSSLPFRRFFPFGPATL